MSHKHVSISNNPSPIVGAAVAAVVLAGLTTSQALGQQNLTCGALIPDSIAAPGETDFFTFEAQAGDDVLLTLVNTSNWGGPVAQATLFDPMNVEVFTFNANSTQRFALEMSGTYVLRLRANNLVSGGSYNLGLECLVPLSPNSTHLCCGALAGGSIKASGEADFFTFEVQADDDVQLTLVNTSNWGGPVAQATLFDPMNVEVLTFNANSTQRFALEKSGTYVLRVRANNLVSGGSYNLGLECLVPLSPSPTQLTCGALLGGSIGASGEADFFTFEAQADDDVQLTLVNTSNWGGPVAQATLFDPMNVEVLTFNANSTPKVAIVKSGTYVLRLRANNLVSGGSYNLGLEYLPLRPCGVIIVEKQTLPDRAPDLFEFSGDAAGVVADGGRIVVAELLPGTYTSTEILPEGWNLTSIQCDDNNSSGDINTKTATFQLETSETITCVFTNIAEGHEAVLLSSSPACDGSLWRTEKNIVVLKFDRDIATPSAGELMVQEIMPGGAVGADLSANFSFSVCGKKLRIVETVPSLVHRKWYRITNMGGWAGAADFERDYVVQVGDADGNRFVTAIDVGRVNASPTGPVEVDSRFDIDGNGFRTSVDVGLANASQGPLPGKPNGHGCNP